MSRQFTADAVQFRFKIFNHLIGLAITKNTVFIDELFHQNLKSIVSNARIARRITDFQQVAVSQTRH